MENRIAWFMRKTGPARMLIPVGLMLIVLGVIALGFRSDHFAQTTGRITSVVENTGAGQRKVYDVGFTYAVNGAEYEGLFANLSGSYAEGEEIQVYYNPDHPQQTAISRTSPLVAPVMIALGALAMGLGIRRAARAFGRGEAPDRDASGSGGF